MVLVRIHFKGIESCCELYREGRLGDPQCVDIREILDFAMERIGDEITVYEFEHEEDPTLDLYSIDMAYGSSQDELVKEWMKMIIKRFPNAAYQIPLYYQI